MHTRRRMAALLFAGTLAASLGMSTAAAAHASVDPGNSWAEIWNPYSRAQGNTLCVDNPGGSTTYATPLQLFHCHGYASNGTPQRWVFTATGFTASNGDPVYQISNAGTGLCIGPGGNAPNAGSRLDQVSCNQDTFGATWWEMQSRNAYAGDPDFELIWDSAFSSAYPPVCVSAANFSDSNGTPLVLSPCRSFTDPSQIWNLG